MPSDERDEIYQDPEDTRPTLVDNDFSDEEQEWFHTMEYDPAQKDVLVSNLKLHGQICESCPSSGKCPPSCYV